MPKSIDQNFDLNKLEFHLKNTTRAFVLIQLNNQAYEKKLIHRIHAIKPSTIVFDLMASDFRSSIDILKEKSDIRSVIYRGLDSQNHDLSSILDKINLSRDLLLSLDKDFIFIVPEYVGNKIQDELPNLYSYFTLKEKYITKYPFIFEFILPGKNYFISKESQYESKKYFFMSNSGIEERLDYFSHTKAKKRELVALRYDIDTLIATEKKLQLDTRYCIYLKLRLAKVYMAQENYSLALNLLNTIISDQHIYTDYPNIYYEALLLKSDITFYEKNYSIALENYTAMMTHIQKQNACNSDNSYIDYIRKILSRISICYAKAAHYQKAYDTMCSSLRYAKETNDHQNYFDIQYNLILIAMRLETIQDYQINGLFHDLELSIQNNMQKAMYLTMSAWYQGVIKGNHKDGLKYAHEALWFKRNFFVENDIRIAESHYVISLLYLSINEIKNAHNCLKKCVNILSNFESQKYKVNQLSELMESITQLLMNTST